MTSIREEMWTNRAILFNFAISDLKVRYRNSILGVLWSIIQPLLMLSVHNFVISTMFKFDIPNFPIYLLLGIIIYNCFKNGTSFALNSLTNRSALITQIYFPRSIPAISSAITASIMLAIEVGILLIFMIAFQFVPPITILLLPLVLGLQFMFVVGVCLPLSVLNVKFKDTEFIWNVVVHASFFLTPIFYQFDMLPEYVQNILQFSPMVQILTMAHHVVLYGMLPTVTSILYAVCSISVITLIGYLIFRKYQTKIVEDM